MNRKLIALFFTLGLALVLFSNALSQDAEIEPNNSCATAQDLGEVTLPYILDGNLEVLPEKGDVDFFRISGPPNSWVRVDLEGQASGQGTLQDPLLGAFYSACWQFAVNDDFNGLNSSVLFRIPWDGVFVLAATSCCDYNFVGNSSVGGTYKMTISQVPTIGSISGRGVDANTGEPLPGTSFPNAVADLYRIFPSGNLEWVKNQQLDGLGVFQFAVDHNGEPLIEGTYQVYIYANSYISGNSEPFDVSGDEHKDLGSIAMTPMPAIGSISGKLVDAISGAPLPNLAPFSAGVNLERCPWEGYCYSIASVVTDELGQFVFSKASLGYGIEPGIFRITAHANGYNDFSSALFDVADGQDMDLGDIGLYPSASISGRVVDAVSGNPLPGDGPPNTRVWLQRCDEWGCWEIFSQAPASDGTFRFIGNSWNPLSPGSYRLTITATSYQQSLVGPFDLAEGEQKDLGNIPLTPLPPEPSISGRIVDANSGNPLPGGSHPFASVELQRCYQWGCWYYTSQLVASDGTFRFVGYPWNPLSPGSYRLRVTASSYEESMVGPFDLLEGEQKDLGDVALSPITYIGSIQGRVVDAINSEPISASVSLMHCYNYSGVCNSWWWVNSAFADSTGAFSFERDYNGNLLQSGLYMIDVYADNFYWREETFHVGENEHKDLGDIALTPFPILISDIQPCNDVPSKGGKCSYSMRITNRQTTSIEGSAWSLVETNYTASFIGNTNFQAGSVSLKLNPEQSTVVRFNFQVPGNVPDGAYICTEVYVGQGKFEGYFYPQGYNYLFCMYKGTDTFEVMSKDETSRLMHQKRQPAVVPSPK